MRTPQLAAETRKRCVCRCDRHIIVVIILYCVLYNKKQRKGDRDEKNVSEHRGAAASAVGSARVCGCEIAIISTSIRDTHTDLLGRCVC